MIFAQTPKVTNEQIMARMNEGIHDLNSLKGWIALLVLAVFVFGVLVIIQIIVKFVVEARIQIALAKIVTHSDIMARQGRQTDYRAQEISESAESMKKSSRRVEDTVNKIPIVAMVPNESGEGMMPVVPAPAVVVQPKAG